MIQHKWQNPTDVPTPQAGNSTFFFDATKSGKSSVKFSDGTIIDLEDAQKILFSMPSYENQEEAILGNIRQDSSWYCRNDKTYKRGYYDIISYSAGVGSISFVNTTPFVDSYDVLIPFALSSYQLSDLHNVDSFQYSVVFCNNGNYAQLNSGKDLTSDATFNLAANGAGAYIIDTSYNISNGDSFSTICFAKVDAVGNIIAIIKNEGSIVNSKTGLLIEISPVVSQVGCLEKIMIVVADSKNTVTTLGEFSSGSIKIPNDSILIGSYMSLDSGLWTDIPSEYLNAPQSFSASFRINIQ